MWKLIFDMLTDMEQVIMLKILVAYMMKEDNAGHYLTFTHTGGLYTSVGFRVKLMCLQLFDKCFVKIIDMTENFNNFVFKIFHGFFLFWLGVTTNLGRILFYIPLNIK